MPRFGSRAATFGSDVASLYEHRRSSLLVFILSAASRAVIDTPAFLYLMGAAVVYRLVMLILSARDL